MFMFLVAICARGIYPLSGGGYPARGRRGSRTPWTLCQGGLHSCSRCPGDDPGHASRPYPLGAKTALPVRGPRTGVLRRTAASATGRRRGARLTFRCAHWSGRRRSWPSLRRTPAATRFLTISGPHSPPSGVPNCHRPRVRARRPMHDRATRPRRRRRKAMMKSGRRRRTKPEYGSTTYRFRYAASTLRAANWSGYGMDTWSQRSRTGAMSWSIARSPIGNLRASWPCKSMTT